MIHKETYMYETLRDYWGLMRFKETTQNSKRLMGIHKTQRNFWELRRLKRLKEIYKTQMDS